MVAKVGGIQFQVKWMEPATSTYRHLREDAKAAAQNRARANNNKTSKQEGLFKQVKKAVDYLQQNPRHPGLNTHEYHSMPNPVRPAEKVWEAYVQNRTSGAYRIFWAYGPGQNELTIFAITPHP